MRNLKARASVCIITAAGLWGWGLAHALGKSALTTQDYTEIQELSAKYATYFDNDERDGAAWAELFTPDGEFVAGDHKVVGTKALVEFVNGVHSGVGKGNLRHWFGNLVMKQVPEGVQARQYVIVLTVGNLPTVRTTAIHETLLVKTSDGWRIKRETVFQDKVSD